jgi:hypothetical protein
MTMQDLTIQGLLNWLHLDRLSDSTLLLLGVAFGLVAKNFYTIAMRSFGFVGGFASRLAVGWLEDVRRETPNVVDFAMVAVTACGGKQVLLMDPLIGSRRLSDVYLNQHTAFGVRLQTFSITQDMPWVRFRREVDLPLGLRLARALRRMVKPKSMSPLSPRDHQLLRLRRAYAPLENLIGQYLTNQWSAQMAIGEPSHVFRFVIAVVYEKNADRHMDRHFHVLVIWEELLRHLPEDEVVTYHPEYHHRWETIRRISEYYRSSPEAASEFGCLNVIMPKRTLLNDYVMDWVRNAEGEFVPVSRPVARPE